MATKGHLALLVVGVLLAQGSGPQPSPPSPPALAQSIQLWEANPLLQSLRLGHGPGLVWTLLGHSESHLLQRVTGTHVGLHADSVAGAPGTQALAPAGERRPHVGPED